MIRMLSHDDLETFANAAAHIPVINAMTARYHPCQLLADVQTFEELRGPIGGRRVAFIGDGYNMCNSYINASRQWGFELRLACPPGHEPSLFHIGRRGNASLLETPEEAVAGAHLVVTDVWSSIGHEEEQDGAARNASPPTKSTKTLLDQATDDVTAIPALPARPPRRGSQLPRCSTTPAAALGWRPAIACTAKRRCLSFCCSIRRTSIASAMLIL